MDATSRTGKEYNEFFEALRAFCTAINYKMPDIEVMLYGRYIPPHLFGKAKEVLETYICNRGDYARPPSLIQMLKKLEIPIPKNLLTDEDIIEQVVSKIGTAIVTWKKEQGDDARSFVGQLGWETIKAIGGWAHLCDSDNFRLRDVNTAAKAAAKILMTKGLKDEPFPKEIPIILNTETPVPKDIRDFSKSLKFPVTMRGDREREVGEILTRDEAQKYMDLGYSFVDINQHQARLKEVNRLRNATAAQKSEENKK